MESSAKRRMTSEEYLAWCAHQEERYELVDGFPVRIMSGASNFHDAIVINIIGELRNQLRGKRRRPMTADTPVKTRIRSFRRPDVTVMCGPLQALTYEASDPRLAVEVLSPTNFGVSWERKLEEYRRLQGLRDVLLVDSERVAATLYTRTATDWVPTDVDGLDAVLELPLIECRLALKDVYDGIDDTAPEDGPDSAIEQPA